MASPRPSTVTTRDEAAAAGPVPFWTSAAGPSGTHAYLAARRPDALLYRIELSEPVLAIGERLLAEERLDDRVHLRHGDMTDVLGIVPAQVHLVSCVLALHQLRAASDVVRTLEHVATIRDRTGCAICRGTWPGCPTTAS
jgi:hypothetical protein